MKQQKMKINQQVNLGNLLKLPWLMSLLLFIALNSNAQNNPWLPPFDLSNEYLYDAEEFEEGDRASNCQNSSPDYENNYGRYKFYLDHYEERPITTVMLNLNFWQKDDGTGNWQDTPEHRARLNQIVSWINQIFGSNCQTSNPLSNPLVQDISDTKIRFEINNLFFEQNTSFWEASYPTADNILTDELVLNHPERLDQLNIHITGGSGPSYAVFPVDWNIQDKHHYVIHFNNEANPASDYAMAVNLAHELGHNFDLQHTYFNHHVCDEENPEYLDDVHGIDGVNSNCTHDYCSWSSMDPFDEDPNTTCTNNVMGASNSACYFSPKQIARMHRALALKSIRKYVKCESFDAPPIEITSNETWDFDIKFYNPIIVKPGANLNLQCKVTMSDDDNIFIEQGGKVHVQGGTVTNACSMWKGFEIWGNSGQNQFTGNQGELILSQDATIEHAFNAVTTWKLNSYSESGGIVRAYNSNFKNCRRAVEFRAYRNTHPVTEQEVKNKSKFTDCKFTWTDEYRWPDQTTKTQISMNQVYGVYVNDCEFSDERVGLPIDLHGDGIYTLDAGYNVNRSDFNNLRRGIEAGNGCTGYTVKVDRSNFNSNLIASKFDAVNGVSYTRNTINISDALSDLGYALGVYMIGCNGHRIEENVITGNNLSSVAGIVIQDGGPNDIAVYKNTVDGCFIGEYAIGKNQAVTDVLFKPGLEFNCHSNSQNYTDIDVNDGVTGMHTELYGVRSNQGDGGRSAENTFTSAPTHSFGHIHIADNLAGQNYEYFHNGIAPSSVSSNVTVNPIPQGSNTCESNIPSFPVGVGVSMSANTYKKTKKEFFKAIKKYKKKTDLYKESLDGSDKDARMSSITNAQVGDANLLFNELDQFSPFLSEEVLKSAAERTDVFPYNMVFVLCCNNPEITKNQSFLNFLKTKNDPFTDAEVESFRAITSTLKTKRGKLDDEISEHHYQLAMKGNYLIQHYKHDTINIHYDSIKYFINELDEPTREMELVAHFIQEGNFDEASTYLASEKPDLLSNENPYREGHFGCIQFYEDVIPHMQNQNSIYEMTEPTLHTLRTFAEGIKIDACFRSRNILNWAYDGAYKSDFVWPTYTKSGLNKLEQVEEVFETQFSLQPNPAQDYVQLNQLVDLEDRDGVRKVQLINGSGQILATETWSNSQPAKVLNTSKYDNGVYFIVLYNNDKPIQTEKLIIKK